MPEALAPAPSHTAARSCARVLLDYLKAEGVECVFGIPGGPVTPLFDALHGETALRTVATRHEAGAAFMAAGYARLSGRLGVAFLTTGPGATNALTGAAAAMSDGLPVLFVTAQVATVVFGKGSLQDSTQDRADIVEMFRPVTKMSAMLSHPDNLGVLLRQALRTALTGRRGPVHINLPTDLMRRPCSDEGLLPHRYRPMARTFDREAVKEAARALMAANFPSVLAGHGCYLAGAAPELLELAEALELPVATTPKGKGVFPEDHPLSLRVFGMAGSPWAEKRLLSENTDLLFCVGTSLHEISTQGWDKRLGTGRSMIQLDIDPGAVGRNYPVDTALIGDAKTTLRELIFEVRRLAARGEHPWGRARGEVARFKASLAPFENSEASRSDLLPMKPQRLLRELDAALPEDAVIFLDVGNHALWALHWLEARGRRIFAHNWGEFAAMGTGVAGAVGGKLARPERPVAAIVGDGGFAMAGMEVLTAVTYGVPVVWIVFNDGRFNTVHHGQTMQYSGRTIATEFHRIDAAAVARGLGADGVSVGAPEEVGPALRAAFASGRPTVVDVSFDRDEVPPIESRVRSLERFFAEAEGRPCPF